MVPLVTPFTASFDIDWPAFDAHVARLLASGIEVLIPADLVGEAWALERAEKMMLFGRAGWQCKECPFRSRCWAWG